MCSCGSYRTRNHGISKFFGSIVDLHRISRNNLHVLVGHFVHGGLDAHLLLVHRNRLLRLALQANGHRHRKNPQQLRLGQDGVRHLASDHLDDVRLKPQLLAQPSDRFAAHGALRGQHNVAIVLVHATDPDALHPLAVQLLAQARRVNRHAHHHHLAERDDRRLVRHAIPRLVGRHCSRSSGLEPRRAPCRMPQHPREERVSRDHGLASARLIVHHHGSHIRLDRLVGPLHGPSHLVLGAHDGLQPRHPRHSERLHLLCQLHHGRLIVIPQTHLLTVHAVQEA